MVKDVFNARAPKFKEMQLNKSAGILDDHAIRKNVATREGTIEKVPVNNSDITNKVYVDGKIADLTYWDRTGTTISPKTSGDTIDLKNSKLLFSGTGNYEVGNNDYAFVSAFDNDIGLYFSLTNARYEFRTTTGGAVASINALSGHIITDGGVTIGTNNFIGMGNPGSAAKARIRFVDQTTDLIVLEYSDIRMGEGVNYVLFEKDSGKQVFVGSNAGLPFAEIYVSGNTTAQSIPTGATPTKSTAFASNGNSNNATADASNDKITITKIGKYKVEGTFSFKSGTANINWIGSAFLDGTEQSQLKFKTKTLVVSDFLTASFTGIIDVTSANKDLDFRIRHDNGSSVNLTISEANLNILQVGGT